MTLVPLCGSLDGIMVASASAAWWETSLEEIGVQGMEKLLPRDASWNDVLQSGREDLQVALEVTEMTTGKDRTVVEIGCGLGRISYALAEHFGKVVGIDVAPSLLEQARARNDGKDVVFELGNGTSLRPQAVSETDTVFSYEVLYILPPAVLARYFRDVATLLAPGGEFVFQMNLEPLRWTTRLSYVCRDGLWRMGIKEWRGWPTGPGFRRYGYTRSWVCRALSEVGLQVKRVSGPSRTQMWFVAKKPLEAGTARV